MPWSKRQWVTQSIGECFLQRAACALERAQERIPRLSGVLMDAVKYIARHLEAGANQREGPVSYRIKC